jgi:hypothetical protein
VVLKIDPAKSNTTFLERAELVERIQQKMEGINGIGNTMSVVTYAPPLEVKRLGLVSKRTMRGVLNKKLEEHRDEYLASDFLSVEDNVELWRISARVGALNDIDYGEFKRDIQACVEPLLKAERDRLAKATAKETAKASVEESPTIQPVSFDEPIDGVSPTQIAEKPWSDDRGISACYTGLVPLVYKAQRSMLNGLAWNFVTDVLTITAVMVIVFRDVAAGLVLLIPSIFPMTIVFGIMGWCGVVIDVGTIMTPTVALGVSVDDVVHFLIWYRRGLSEGKSRRDAVMLAYEGCARAMYQSWSVLGLGLAVFSLSTFVPTQRFGAMMFTLLTAALVGNLILLPCILRSPLGWFFLRRLRRDVQRHPERYRIGVHASIEPAPPRSHVDRPHQRETPHRRPPALRPDAKVE